MVTLCRKKKVSYEYYKVNIREDSDPDPGKTLPDPQTLFDKSEHLHFCTI